MVFSSVRAAENTPTPKIFKEVMTTNIVLVEVWCKVSCNNVLWEVYMSVCIGWWCWGRGMLPVIILRRQGGYLGIWYTVETGNK